MRRRLAAVLVLVPLAAAAQDAPRHSPDLLASESARAVEVARFHDSAQNLVAALRPAPASRRDTADYRQSVYPMTLTTHPGIAEETAYDPAAPTAPHRVVLDDNSTRDLPVPFASGETSLGPAARIVLDTLGEALADPSLAGARYLVAAHTDVVGDAATNQWLSEKRALAVVADLVARHDIDPARLVAAGFGEAYPLADVPGDSPRNRRIEVTLIDADEGVGAAVASAAPPPLPRADADPYADTDAAPPRDDLPGAAPDADVPDYAARRDAIAARRAARVDARRALREEIRQARIARAIAGVGTEVPEAVLDSHGRIVGARPVRPYLPAVRPAPCRAVDGWVGACDRVMVLP